MSQMKHYIETFMEMAEEAILNDFFCMTGREMTKEEEKILLTSDTIWNRAEAMAQDHRANGMDGNRYE
jgi:hypothetical protein